MIDEKRATALHRAAMDYVDQALAAGSPEESRQFFRLAFISEAEAANMLKEELQEEPTRSILYRSAATLALDCQDYQASKRLLAKGLTGNPERHYKKELLALLQVVLLREGSSSADHDTTDRLFFFGKSNSLEQRVSAREYVEEFSRTFLQSLGYRGEDMIKLRRRVVKSFDEAAPMLGYEIDFNAKIAGWCQEAIGN